MGASKNNGTPKSSILIGFSIINYKPSILGVLPLFLVQHPIWSYHGEEVISIPCDLTRWLESRRVVESADGPWWGVPTQLEGGEAVVISPSFWKPSKSRGFLEAMVLVESIFWGQEFFEIICEYL